MMTEVERANQKAQEAFRAALVDKERNGRWDPVLEDAYLNAEADADWEEEKALFDALQSNDHDMHDKLGVCVGECDDCMTGFDPEVVVITETAFLQALEAWTPGELVEGFGK
jgi:hypothetical protein